jgi:hypothetical protein
MNRSTSVTVLAIAVLAIQAVPMTARAEVRSPAACDQVDYGSIQSGNVQSDPMLPPNLNGPTLVGVGFDPLDIRDIIPVAGSYQYRGYVRTGWCDPRLAFDGDTPRIYTGEQVDKILGEIWFPRGYPSNKIGEISMSERVLRIHPDGTVLQDLNVSIRVAAHYDLRRFPFDEQDLALQIESYIWDRDRVKLVVNSMMTGFGAGLRIPEWTVMGVKASIDEVSRLRGSIPYSRFTLTLSLIRNPGFFLWKVFLPLSVIVALSWSVFWMSEESLASRSRITATGILTIVAYQFVFAADLPRIGYLTVLDKVMIWSFGLLAVTVLESMIVTKTMPKAPETARRIDRTSRWLFPVVYSVVTFVLINA